MALAAGTRLGRYEILSQLGAGGMGEVYRAQDAQLGRVIAIKVLPRQTSTDPEAVSRFEREAKSVAALSHPNILAMFDFGTHDGVVYAAMELLEGESLRSRIAAGPLPPRRAVEYALQICQGLGAAHEKGIVHRDLKPENLFVTRDNRIKILDFGLAKLTRTQGMHERETVDLEPPTEPGTVLGTVGYMSPEQVRGAEVDARSDIFSFGAVLYEMLAGRRAFKADSAVETMSAILKHDPPELGETNHNIDPALDRIVRHCLEKQPDARFQSARDLAFQLESLSSVSSSAVTRRAAIGAPRALRRVPWPAAVGALLLGLAAGFVAHSHARGPQPSYQQLTFRNGTLSAARFAPDGNTIVYSAAWNGRPVELLTLRPESPESRSLELPRAGLFAISSEGEMAIATGCEFFWGRCHGTLARAPLSGGAPRELLRDVHEAEWAPGGAELAVVRDVNGRQQLEFPVNHVLYEPAGWISHLRFSPAGDLIAFIDHPSMGDEGGTISVIDRAGKVRVLASGWGSAWGLAWHPSNGELWFTAAADGLIQQLRAVTLSGRQRIVLASPTRLILHDISRAGRVLLARETARGGMMSFHAGDTREQDLSWFDWSAMAHLADDGKKILFCERGEGTRGTPTIYLRGIDGSAAVNLGEGRPLALSADGAWVLAMTSTLDKLRLLPTGAGDPRTIPTDPLVRITRASFFPHSNRLAILGYEKGHRRRCYVLDLDKGTPRAISPEGKSVDFIGDSISPDETRLAATGPDGQVVLYPVDQGTPTMVPGVASGAVPIQWSPDGRFLYVYERESLPAHIRRVNLESHEVTPWKDLLPGDATGIVRVPNVDLSADGQSYVYTYSQRLSELYLAEGLR